MVSCFAVRATGQQYFADGDQPLRVPAVENDDDAPVFRRSDDKPLGYDAELPRPPSKTRSVPIPNAGIDEMDSASWYDSASRFDSAARRTDSGPHGARSRNAGEQPQPNLPGEHAPVAYNVWRDSGTSLDPLPYSPPDVGSHVSGSPALGSKPRYISYPPAPARPPIAAAHYAIDNGQDEPEPYFDPDASHVIQRALRDDSRNYAGQGDGEVYYPTTVVGPNELWMWHVLPHGQIYRPYIASPKESRLGAQITSIEHDSTMWEGFLGGRVPLVRYGTYGGIFPQGIQLDAEACAQARLDMDDDVDVRSTDYRVGFPLTFGYGNQQTKIAYYHLSSHLGDEFLLKNPGYPRLNYARDVIVLGHSIYFNGQVRVYGEIGYAFYTIETKPWEVQFGIESAPLYPTGFAGAPYWAMNAHLKEENNFSGTFTAQVGWAWRGDSNDGLFRIGLQYFNGKSSQNSFYFVNEESIAIGMWYDF